MSVAVYPKALLLYVVGTKRKDAVDLRFVLAAGLGNVEVIVTSEHTDAVVVKHNDRSWTVTTNQQPNVMHWTYHWFQNWNSNAPAEVARIQRPRDTCSFNLIFFAERMANVVLKKGGA